MTRLLGGARLSVGGLHLGHYIGNILPYYDFEQPKEYFFIIKDTEPLFWNSMKEKENTLIDMVSDILSVSFSDSIKISTTSRIHPHTYFLNSIIKDEVTFNQLISTHFKKSDFRSEKSSHKLKYFLFPIDEIITFLSLNIDYFLSNDDNKRLVQFGRTISDRLNKRFGTNLKKIELKTNKEITRLLGHNYERMCKSNNNTIRITEAENTLRKELGKLSSHSYYIRKYPDDKNNESFSEEYIPFQLFKIFTNNDLSLDEKIYFSKSENKNELDAIIFKLVNDEFQINRNRKQQFHNKESVFDRLEKDSKYIKDCILENEIINKFS